MDTTERLPDQIDIDGLENVTRLEVIGEYRELVRYGISIRFMLLQDEGRTLKIFIEQSNSGTDDTADNEKVPR
ncbi:hypothetical protein [uncultured Roseibium sp.]|uniref:hypothetical protein n=1 Tax=uncultured Roseibium sp. TaxID=1936171 RepID=UPI003217C9AB